MEDMLMQFTGLGVCGVVAYKLFEVFLKEKEEDKKSFLLELKEQREMYREELAKDRQMYRESLNGLFNRVENIEQDIQDIKHTIENKK